MVEPAGNVASVVSLVLEVGKWFARPIGRRFMYLYNHRNNLDNLEEEVRKLKGANKEVQDKVVAAEKNVETIKQNVMQWQKEANSIINEAEQLIAEKANDRCFKGFCPNLITRYKHGKKAFEIKEGKISPLLQRRNEFDVVSDPTRLEDMWLKPDKNYGLFTSRDSTFKNILKALNDANVNVGVCGMGGIGKTTLVKEIGRQAKTDKIFDVVIFVEVNKTPDIEMIQQEIARNLGVKFEEETQRASKLCERLKKKEEKILIILDNLWDDFDLKSVGIPDEVDDRGCKLLLTARERPLLEKMGCDPFPIDSLSDDESWRLFKKTAGEFVETREFKTLAENICEKCGGLPIAVVTVAKALKTKRHSSQWKEALRQLKRSSSKNFTREMKEAYATIELSYKYLKGEELQKTFLLCSLMRNQAFSLDLVKYVIGLDIFQGIYAMKEARDKVNALIYDLKDSCLLLNGHTYESFSMHDFVREVALSIANRDDQVFSVRNEIRWEWPHQDRLKICKKIFVRDSTIDDRSMVFLDCPQLESLFMNTKVGDSHVKIPDNFFRGMKKLKVLDLTRMQFSSLQLSLSLLVNLQTLCLDYSKFEDVAIIGELMKLKILSLRGSSVEQLPKEIGQLTQLKLLDLSDCKQLEVIAPNVLSNLVGLEELYMNGCSVLWEVEGRDVQRSNASLEELKHLRYLTTLEIDIEDDKIVPEGLFTEKLDRYKISIGAGSSKIWGYMDIKSFGFDRTLKLKLNSTIWSDKLQGFKNVEFLCLQSNDNNLEDELDTFTPLFNGKVVFPNLKTLELAAINSEMIWDNQLPTMSSCYQSLTHLIISNMEKLNYVFPSSMVKSFEQLQHLEIRNCEELREIVGKEEGAEAAATFVFPEVEFLQLMYLPKLTTFYSGIHTSNWPKLMKLEVFNCWNLHIFTSEYKVVFPNLVDVRLHAINSQMIWDSQLPVTSDGYKNLTSLVIEYIEKLKYVFPSSLVKNFEQLQHFEISSCKELKEIVAKEGAEAPPTFFFPRVEFLKLGNLPELKTFYPGKHTSEWPSLKKLEVSGCEKLQIFTSECKVVLPDLEALELQGTNTEKIWHSQLLKTSSGPRKLTRLILRNCEKLKYVFPYSMIKSFGQLEHLEISTCKELKEVVTKKDGEKTIAKFEFPHVAFLKLNDLPELTTFCLGISTLEWPWPKLKKLEVSDCDKLQMLPSENKINPNLEELELVLRADNMMTWQCLLPENFSCKCTVKINGDKSTNIPIDVLKKSFHLEKLRLCESSYKEIFSYGWDDRHTGTLMQIKSLELKSLFNLKNIWRKDSKVDSVIQNLEVLKVNHCNKLRCVLPPLACFANLTVLSIGFCEILSCMLPSSASFANLTVLSISACRGLIKLFTLSTAKSMVQLREVKIVACSMLIEVVSNEEDVGVEDGIVFDKLKLLSLDYLQSLTCFYYGNFTLKFPALEELIVVSCPNMKTFSEGDTSAPCLQKVKRYEWDKEGYWKSDLNTTIQQLYQKKELTLSGKDIMSMWPNQFPEHRLSKVKVVNVIQNEPTNILIEILQRFTNLEKLVLKGNSYQELFSCGEGEKHAEMLTHIKQLELQGLFNLKHMWKQDSHQVSILRNLEELLVHHCHNLINLVSSSASFDSLKTLNVRNCDGLVNLVTSSTAKSMVNLEKMYIGDCESMVEIVANTGDAEKDEIVFSKLKSLRLLNLESLNSFCSGNHAFKFPALEDMMVEECPKMNIFSRGLRFNNLETLVLKGNSYQELFSCGEGEKHAAKLTHIKRLQLWRLFNVKHLWKQDSHQVSILRNLEELFVYQCHNLINLVPSSASFDNLTTLSVWNCDGLENLVTSSTAKSMVNLEYMFITGCETMVEIIANTGDVEKDEIVFSKLKSLSLRNLESLRSFCSGNQTLKFPALEYMTVIKCPKMNTFSRGVLSTPKLDKVKENEDDDEGHWEGDLNTTIQHLFKEAVAQELPGSSSKSA